MGIVNFNAELDDETAGKLALAAAERQMPTEGIVILTITRMLEGEGPVQPVNEQMAAYADRIEASPPKTAEEIRETAETLRYFAQFCTTEATRPLDADARKKKKVAKGGGKKKSRKDVAAG